MKSWIAVTGMPDFMQRMQRAAKAYKKYLVNIGEFNEHDLKYFKERTDILPQAEPAKREIPEVKPDGTKTEVATADDDDFLELCGEGGRNIEHTEEELVNLSAQVPVAEGDDGQCVDYDCDDITVGIVSPSATASDNSYWRYLKPFYYFSNFF